MPVLIYILSIKKNNIIIKKYKSYKFNDLDVINVVTFMYLEQQRSSKFCIMKAGKLVYSYLGLYNAVA